MSKHRNAGQTTLGRLQSAFAFRHRHPVARTLSMLLAVTTAALVAVVGFGPSAAAASPCPIPGGFEIDGDMTQATCTPSGDDWNTTGIGVRQTTQGGTYSTAGKDGGDPSGWVSSGSTPIKTDFERAYATSRVVSGHFFVYVAWERTNTTGTQGYAIEIDNSETNVAADGTPQPDRSHGGAVFYISSQGAAAPQFDSACTFTSQSDYGTTCTSSSTGVTAAINTASMSDPLAGTTQDAGSFFEVALDVTSYTGIAPSCPGASADSVYLRSVTGQTSNGNLKGYMAPLSVAPDSTCVQPTISTQTQQNTPIDGLDVVAPGTAQHDVATVTGNGAHPAPTGSVAFFLCGPTGSAADCTTGGQAAGTPALVQHATNSTAQSSDLAPTAPGWYCWRAEFTPDPVNSDNPFLAATATIRTNECFRVAHATPTISTASSATTDAGAAAHSVGFTTIGDTATLSDVYPGADLTGQHVTFSLYGPLGSTPGANDCVANKLVLGPQDAALTQTDATTWTATAPTYKPTASDGPGYYTWVASYAGDQVNAGDTGACGAANETQNLVGPLLTLTKGTPHSTISAGDDLVYDVNLANVGSGTASGVVVTDVLPVLAGGGSWSLAATSGYGCSIAAGTGPNAGHQVVTCSVGHLDPSSSTQIAEVTAPTTAADCGTVSNTATLAADPDIALSAGPVTIHVQCPGVSLTKTADAATVSAGSQIGFTVTATNSSVAGTGTATGVVIDDPLPAGSGVTWTMDTGPTNCAVQGSAPNQTLHCTAVDLAPGASEAVHVVSGTAYASCQAYANTATLAAGNQAPLTATATTTVLCPALTLTKTADAATVDAGQQIGFTVTAVNGDAPGTGTADGVVVDDPLPSGAGVSWSITPASQGCSITGSAPSQTLHCAGITLEPGASISVHVVSATTTASCQAYPNVATLSATNAPTLTANASTAVANCVIVSPPIVSPPQQHPSVLPNTGGPGRWLVPIGLALLLAGTALVVGERRRRRRS